jgi:hypothetical protein
MMEYIMSRNDSFERALKDAKKALREAFEQRAAIEERILSLKQTIKGLSALCEGDADDELVPVGNGILGHEMSLTDAIRCAFSQSREFMLTPPEVRDALASMGVDLAKYKQVLVPIHNTLKRLEKQGEIVAFKDDGGNIRGYRWVSPLARAVEEVDGPPKVRRATPPNSSFAAKAFAEEDARRNR